ncbi:MAG: flagellar biosynthesis protein FliR [Actinomycetota bacterium]|nr:flagellar biosynthesis protein FliR [Actinomycetota bacterium]
MTGLQVAVGESALAAFLLAMARVAGFILVAPPFNTRTVPGKVKVALAAGLALPLSVAYSDPPSLGSAAMLLNALLQVLTGMALGFLVLAAVSTIQSAGDLLDTVGGFSITMAMDPLMMMQTSVLGRLHQMTAAVLLFVTDGHLLILRGLTRGVETMPGPLASWADAARAAIAALSSLFAGALQIAAPVVAAMLVADVALGLLTRAAPALNAFAMGYPLKILFTLLLAVLVVSRLPGALEILVSGAVGEVLRLTRGG